jgi:hypothetical protein
MTISDVCIVGATLVGPIIAVQVTRYLDDAKERRGRKLWVFQTLMATRSYTLAQAHVEALNRIDLEFSAENDKERPVVGAWRAYLDLLGARGMSEDQWVLRRTDLLIDLLFHMGVALGYDFDRTHIKNATYAPMAHGRLEEQQEAIRQGVVDLMAGKRVIPIAVTTMPLVDDPVLHATAELPVKAVTGG